MTWAAIAYIGKNGAGYLPLKKGDRLVVDMSLGAVRQGVTDPKEIRKLLKRKVEVFTRKSLHAKLVVADDTLLVGSANVSRNAREVLDEAALMTTNRRAVGDAKRYIKSLCSEPVLPRYLAQCIREYRPPRFKAARTISQRASTHTAKLWFIAGLVPLDPKKDRDILERIEEKAKKELADPDTTEVTWIRYPKRPALFDHVKPKSWVIDCMKEGKRSRSVGPPCQVMRKVKYVTANGRVCHLLVLERSVDGESMSFSTFKKKLGTVAPFLNRAVVRSTPISDDEAADAMLRLWTRRGRIAKHH